MSNLNKSTSAPLNPSVMLPGGKTVTRTEIMNTLKMKPETPLDAWLLGCDCNGKCDDRCTWKAAADLDKLSKNRLELGKQLLDHTAKTTKITLSEARSLLDAGVISQNSLTALQLQAVRLVDPAKRTC